jgi:hypothetical protein
MCARLSDTHFCIPFSARIQAHRLVWFADLPLHFESGSFKVVTAVAPTHAHVESAHGTPTEPVGESRASESQRLHAMSRDSMATSVRTIVSVSGQPGEEERVLILTRHTQSADNMMELCRADYHLGVSATGPISNPSGGNQFDTSAMGAPQGALAASGEALLAQYMPAQSPLLRHGAFFACAQIVAAFGYVVAVAANRSDEPSVLEPDLNFDLGLSPGRRHEAGHRALWRQRAALSNISFAEANITCCAPVWPIAEKLKAEIRRCRDVVDFGGPTGLGMPSS